MISFKDFIKTFSRKYINITFDDETNRKLMDYALASGFDLTTKFDDSIQKPEDFDFHITIFYTTSTHNTANQTLNIKPFKVKPMKFATLGENHDIPVILVNKSTNLLRIRQLFVGQGYKDAYPTYKPHISLSYKRKPYDFKGLELPSFDLVVDKLHIKDIK